MYVHINILHSDDMYSPNFVQIEHITNIMLFGYNFSLNSSANFENGCDCICLVSLSKTHKEYVELVNLYCDQNSSIVFRFALWHQSFLKIDEFTQKGHCLASFSYFFHVLVRTKSAFSNMAAVIITSRRVRDTLCVEETLYTVNYYSQHSIGFYLIALVVHSKIHCSQLQEAF